jgi:kynurenine 3-monooxygenase
MAARFLETAIPMQGRMLHTESGKLESQLYDPRSGQVILFWSPVQLDFTTCALSQCINSVERGILNEELLDQAEADPSITVFFEHKLSTADFDQSSAVFQCKDHAGRVSNVTVAFDLCIGADGSYSNVRRQMMRVARSAFLV